MRGVGGKVKGSCPSGREEIKTNRTKNKPHQNSATHSPRRLPKAGQDACQVVTVPRGTGVHIVVALTGLTRPHWAPFPKGVPKVAISTVLAAGTWKGQTAKPK